MSQEQELTAGLVFNIIMILSYGPFAVKAQPCLAKAHPTVLAAQLLALSFNI